MLAPDMASITSGGAFAHPDRRSPAVTAYRRDQPQPDAPAQRNPDIRPSSIATSNRWPASRELSTRRNADPTALRSRSRMIVYRICVIASPADGDGSATHHRTIAGNVSIQPDPDLARRQMPRTPSAPSSVRFCHLAAVDIYHHRHGAPVVSIHPSRDRLFLPISRSGGQGRRSSRAPIEPEID